MTREEFRRYCLSKKGAVEDFPFDAETVVFRVAGKIFALANANSFQRINLKCDSDKAIDLREKYKAVIPGYHMNKRHWNSVVLDDSVPDRLIFEWIDDSYNIVVSSLTRAEKQKLEESN